jgi:hypothetical protein
MQVIAAIGVWLIAVPEKAVNLVGAWQLSHAIAPVGMWLGGGAFGTMFAKLSPGP